MNPIFSDFLNILRSIPFKEYIIISLLTFLAYQLLFPFTNIMRNQVTAAIFGFLWIFRWALDFQYSELINLGQQLPFTSVFFPMTSLVYFSFLFFEKERPWYSIRVSIFISLSVGAISLLLF
jgi:hypothetical protein